VTSAADALPYFTGFGHSDNDHAERHARGLIADATASDARSTLGVVIGTGV
jgi:hypothetical protein